MSYFTYILYSPAVDHFYIGSTRELTQRLSRHNNGAEKATKSGVPWTLLWSATKPDRSGAFILERKLKNLSRKRLVEFMLKYEEGVVGPDEAKLVRMLT